MKSSSLALAALSALAASSPFADAFTPVSVRNVNPASSISVRTGWYSSHGLVASSSRSNTSLEMAGASAAFPGQDEEDDEVNDDEEDSDDEDDEEFTSRRSTMRKTESTAFAGLKLDPYDPNPPIKPRPSRKMGFTSSVDDDLVLAEAVPDTELTKVMSDGERKDNLEAMRQIKKFDLADLRLRKDHAGWVEANNDLKARTRSDPWFGLNDRLCDAIQLGDEEEAEKLMALVENVGGPPPGVTVGARGYALYTEIFDVGMSTGRQASMLEQEIIDDRVRRGRAMAAEARANQEKARRRFEEKMRGTGENTEEKEAKERRERMMQRLMGELEEDKKKREERAKEALGKMPDMPEDIQSSFDRALKEAQEDVRKQRRRERLGPGADMENEEDSALAGVDEGEGEGAKKSYADKAREVAAAEASGGRPRLPGDEDITQGEISVPAEESSSTTSGPLTVEVSSNYNSEQSDPPMRKHCFQYTIRITNNSSTDTIQLLSRRFEIQTVGSSMKDVVQGEGVTGRQPVLKPGEVFEYTSTAPLSVRPIGTTEIAARMRGAYRYVVLGEGQETATPEQVKESAENPDGPAAELGMFHFVFPEEQRVKPFQSSDDVDDDDDEDDDDEDDAAPVAESKAQPTGAAGSAGGPSAAKAAPSSALPGDPEMEAGLVHPRDRSVDDSSDTLTDGVRVRVTTSYKLERSDSQLDKHCFQYNIRITNDDSSRSIQLVSRRFEIQTVGSPTKDVVQGPGVTGRQPILKPGESFEYNSTAPLSVKPMMDKTPVVARMEGEYNFVVLGDDGQTPMSSEPLQAKLGRFHFILPALEGV
mmetsp:Transcript_20272/g.58604  ORF Transcript_20272/g.58604 Transcript_20272/m.58604 type:complete len:818 (-) Transcript_20272:456-2909(-)|eukprot:CAMPEP_0113543664 /NCGR_PEP_ID=MMETSP0015_2-20120614/10279_1 /TAXON_ID=2838 /ORGANISM="Odontella" /LENGTH=817 /DNA_ID=CAMNT_0000443839 /DNA_START=191 /DNA_END=2644 /DNA_ORIENTATION=+ /assembly_acc=CAM_ASM_000160